MDKRNQRNHNGEASVPPEAIQVPAELPDNAAQGDQRGDFAEQHLGHRT